MTGIVARQQFVGAIERGIAASRFLSPGAADALRRVAQTATVVGPGYMACGPRAEVCPATMAGLTRAPAPWTAVSKFAETYDHAMAQALGRSPHDFGRIQIDG